MVTFACFHNQPFLGSDRSRSWVCNAIGRARELHMFELWAYVIMPTHVHLLIWPQSPVPSILLSLKQSVANRAVSFARKHQPQTLERMAHRRPSGNVTHRFWQRGGGFYRNLWTPAHIFSAIEYIHMNPVRDGLCGRAEEWKWSSASQYASLRDMVPVAQTMLPIDIDHLPADPR